MSSESLKENLITKPLNGTYHIDLEYEKSQVIDILHEVPCMSIATLHTTKDGLLKPRNIMVAFAFDSQYNLYWVSEIESVHSQDISLEPDVSIAIADLKAPVGERKGVFIEAKAYQIDEKSEAEKPNKLFAVRTGCPERDINLRIDDSPRRIYKAVPYEVRTNYWFTSERGDRIDRKIFLPLPL